MSIETYLLFTVIALATIATPGPGVVMTLTNALKYGIFHSLSGIFGVSLGMFLIALLVGSGLGVILSASAWAYTTLKLVGAGYLLYLGFRLIKNRYAQLQLDTQLPLISPKKMFINGLIVTLTNPKAIVFFIALFPQFISKDAAYGGQFLLLSLTFCAWIVVVHLLYALCAELLRKKSSRNHLKWINIGGGSAYILFAVGLLFSKRSSLN